MSIEKVLNALSNTLRIEIMKKLSREGEMSFTELMQELNLSPRTDAGKFGYHIRMLVENQLIRTNPRTGKYILTDIGKIMTEILWELEDISRRRSRELMVRTSRLTIEPFERRKIVEALMREANVPKKLAEDIAREAEERLIKLEIDYLTAPLIREFVNAILLEQGLEDYRHALTRLGLPVYDVEKLVKEAIYEEGALPDKIHAMAGDAVMEEYTLIKHLPREVSDAHLSGKIHICNANYWSLRPATIHHDMTYFLKNGFAPANMSPIFSYSSPPTSFRSALNFIIRFVHMMQSNLSVGQLIDNFNYILAPYVRGLAPNEIKKALKEMLIHLNQTPTSRGDVIPLAIGISMQSSCEINSEYYEEALELFKMIIQVMYEGDDLGKPFLTPLLIVKLDKKAVQDDEFYEVFMRLCKLTSRWTLPYFINLDVEWQHKDVSYGWDLSRIFPVTKSKKMRGGCLDTVIINLPRIALESKGDDDGFFNNLGDTVELCIKAFDVKRESIRRRLESGHLPLLGFIVDGSHYYKIEDVIGNVGYIGLPEAVKIHTGFWIHEDNSALRFAQKVVEFIKKKISARRKLLGLTHISLENDVESRFEKNDIANFGYAIIKEKLGREVTYTANAHIPLNMSVPLRRRIRIEEQFHEKAINGHGFNVHIKEPVPNEEYFAKVMRWFINNTKLGAFTFTKDITYCKQCMRTYEGYYERCPYCRRAFGNIVYFAKKVNAYTILTKGEERYFKIMRYTL